MVVDRLSPIAMSIFNAANQKADMGSNLGSKNEAKRERITRMTQAGHHSHVRKCLSLLRRHHADFGGTMPNGRESQV
jgi:hypothetical protein